MGKRGRHRPADIGQRVDQHGQRDRSDSAEHGRLRELGQPDPRLAGRDEAREPRGDGNVVPLHQRGVRRLFKRVRLSGSAPRTLSRTFSGPEVNAILNADTVFPDIRTPGIPRYDVSSLLADPRNIALTTGDGVVLFLAKGDGIYDASAHFYPVSRGTYARKAVADAIRWAFVNTDCVTMFARVPAPNRAAAFACAATGAIREFERKSVWPVETGLAGMSFWTLRYENWIKTAPGFYHSGVAFFQRLLSERRRLGSPQPLAGFEDELYRRVGASVEMISGGMADKGVILYNQWAIIGSYPMMTLIARTPTLIKFGDMLLQVIDGGFRAIKCG